MEMSTTKTTIPKMAKLVETIDLIKKWSKEKFRTSKQTVLETFGRGEQTKDPELDKRIEQLHDLHTRYREVLIAATAYSIHFDALKSAWISLAESFYQLSLREAGLKEQLSVQTDTMRKFTESANEFSKQLDHFVSSVETLCDKTIRDTLQTVQVYENARLKFDAHRHELAAMKQVSEGANKSVDELETKVETLKQKYEQLKEDVRVKLTLLDENRLTVMKGQLAKLEKSLHQYFTGNIAALTPKIEVEEKVEAVMIKDEESNYSPVSL